MNLGEQNEILLKAFIVKCFCEKSKLTGAPESLSFIESNRFGPNEKVLSWAKGYEEFLDKRDWESLGKMFGKAKSGYKADIEINGIKYSVKYKNAGKSALLNHTHRRGIIKVCNRIGLNILDFDKIVNDYWNLRESGIIGEDVSNSNSNSPFNKNKELIKKLLEYFLFKGTAQGDSAFPADKLLEFSDPFDPSTFKVLDPGDAVDEIWSSLVFSLRSKAMPKNYNKKDHEDLTPWTRFSSGAYRGSLHIRS